MLIDCLPQEALTVDPIAYKKRWFNEIKNVVHWDKLDQASNSARQSNSF